jgi:uncharacterized protein (TIGR02270 family)
MMLTPSSAPIPFVVQQHAEESAMLRGTRSFLVSAPHVKLHHLRRLDDRIAAHLDGLAVAGEYGWTVVEAALATPGPGEVFTAVVRAIEDRNAAGLDKLLALAEAVPGSQAGLISAFGWVSAESLRGITKALLNSSSAFHRQVALASCAMHRVDPASALDAAILDADAGLRGRALRVAGDVGRLDLLPTCLKALADEDDHCRFQAARSALLLGNRDASVAALQSVALMPGPHRSPALGLLLKVVAPPQAHAVLKSLAQDASSVRTLMQGVGIAGVPHYVPWLIKQMDDLKLTRLAGESFSFITGLDLAYLDLERKPPEGAELGPTDNPEDEDVAMDEDDSLPWPDPAKIEAWWSANSQRFLPGVRCFMGEPPTYPHCLDVLKNGYQRQRIAAALCVSLLQIGTPLFPTSAPAWRQRRWLAKMG